MMLMLLLLLLFKLFVNQKWLKVMMIFHHPRNLFTHSLVLHICFFIIIIIIFFFGAFMAASILLEVSATKSGFFSIIIGRSNAGWIHFLFLLLPSLHYKLLLMLFTLMMPSLMVTCRIWLLLIIIIIIMITFYFIFVSYCHNYFSQSLCPGPFFMLFLLLFYFEKMVAMQFNSFELRISIKMNWDWDWNN